MVVERLSRLALHLVAQLLHIPIFGALFFERAAIHCSLPLALATRSWQQMTENCRRGLHHPPHTPPQIQRWGTLAVASPRYFTTTLSLFVLLLPRQFIECGYVTHPMFRPRILHRECMEGCVPPRFRRALPCRPEQSADNVSWSSPPQIAPWLCAAGPLPICRKSFQSWSLGEPVLTEDQGEPGAL